VPLTSRSGDLVKRWWRNSMFCLRCTASIVDNAAVCKHCSFNNDVEVWQFNFNRPKWEFRDGMARVKFPDGRKVWTNEGGSVTRTEFENRDEYKYSDGVKQTVFLSPPIEGFAFWEHPDGHSHLIRKDGSQYLKNPQGIIFGNPAGERSIWSWQHPDPFWRPQQTE